MAERKLTDKEKLQIKLEKDWKKNIVPIYKKSRDNIKKQVSLLVEKGIDSQTELMRYNRLQKLQEQIEEEIKKLTGDTTKELNNTVKAGYVDSSNLSYYDIETGVGIELDFNLMNKEAAKLAIVNPLDNVGFIQREKDNMKVLVNQLNSVITEGIVQGTGYRAIARSVNEKFDIGYNKSLRIVQTETHRVLEKASFDRAVEAEEAGVEMQKEWLSAFTPTTRDSHASASGQVVAVKEPFIVNGEQLMYPGDPSGELTVSEKPDKDIISNEIEFAYLWEFDIRNSFLFSLFGGTEDLIGTVKNEESIKMENIYTFTDREKAGSFSNIPIRFTLKHDSSYNITENVVFGLDFKTVVGIEEKIIPPSVLGNILPSMGLEFGVKLKIIF